MFWTGVVGVMGNAPFCVLLSTRINFNSFTVNNIIPFLSVYNMDLFGSYLLCLCFADILGIKSVVLCIVYWMFFSLFMITESLNINKKKNIFKLFLLTGN